MCIRDRLEEVATLDLISVYTRMAWDAPLLHPHTLEEATGPTIVPSADQIRICNMSGGIMATVDASAGISVVKLYAITLMASIGSEGWDQTNYKVLVDGRIFRVEKDDMEKLNNG